MFLILQNIIKFTSSIFSFLIFTLSFFLLQLSISFINITPIEFLIKPLLITKIDDYDNSLSDAILYIDNDSKKIITKIKIDLINKEKSEQFLLSSEFKTNLVDFNSIIFSSISFRLWITTSFETGAPNSLSNSLVPEIPF